MGALNVFEYAAKHRVRFPYKGMIATEDLYTLSRSDLDAIYKTLNRARKANEEESLLTEQTKENILLEVQLKIVKHIFEEKQQRVLNAQAEKERAEKKQKMIEQAESLQGNTDWKATTDKFIALQIAAIACSLIPK